MTAPLQTAVLATNPQVYLTLDDPNGPAASDSSGNSHPGVYSGVTVYGVDGVSGGQDRAIQFAPQSNVTPHKVILPANYSDFNRISVMLWMRYYSFSVTEMAMSNQADATQGWALQWNSGTGFFEWEIGSGGGLVLVADTGGYSNLTRLWNCYIGTLDRFTGIAQLWVNGALRGQNTVPMVGTVDSGTGAIGCYNPSSGDTQPYTGDAAHYAIWNRVLTPTEIQSIWAAGGSQVSTVGSVNVDLTPIENSLAALTTSVATLTNRQQYYDQYSLGTAHAGLTGTGSFATLGCLGLLVQLTSLPSNLSQYDGNPTTYLDIGWIAWGDANGYLAHERIMHNPQIFIPIDTSATLIGYSLEAGVVARIVELIRAN